MRLEECRTQLKEIGRSGEDGKLVEFQVGPTQADALAASCQSFPRVTDLQALEIQIELSPNLEIGIRSKKIRSPEEDRKLVEIQTLRQRNDQASSPSREAQGVKIAEAYKKFTSRQYRNQGPSPRGEAGGGKIPEALPKKTSTFPHFSIIPISALPNGFLQNH